MSEYTIQTVEGPELVLDTKTGTIRVRKVLSVASKLAMDAAGADASGTVAVQLVNGANTLNVPAARGDYDGQVVRLRIAQPAAGAAGTVTLNGGYLIPSSASTPLAFSTANSKVDLMVVIWDATKQKWLVVSFIPGY